MSEPLGFYVTCDDAECIDCHDPDAWQGFEGWDEPLAIFTHSEADAPTHCRQCEAVIPHALTGDGLAYVAEIIASGEGRPEIHAMWIEAYGVDLEDFATT